MTPQQETRIRAWHSILSREIGIGLVLTEDERSGDFVRFCESLSRLAPKISVVREEEESRGIPAIRISRSLIFEALPSGTELEPFLEAISLIDKKETKIPPHIRSRLDRMELPASLRLYVSPQCPFCPATVRELVPLSLGNELVRLTITDAGLFPDMARSDNVRSVPTLLLDGNFRWTGAVRAGDLAEILATRDPSDPGVASMERMIIEGNAFVLAEMMLEKKTLFPGFVELLAHGHFTVRLGAMAAMEEIAGRNMKMAAGVSEPLWERFSSAEVQVRGDILHMMGEAAGRDILPKLENIAAEEEDEEVREAAKEAAGKIRERAGF